MSKLKDAISKAEVLIEALPYFTKFSGTTFVVKYGGNAMTNKRIKFLVMQDLALLKSMGVQVVVVHGGGPEIDRNLGRLNIPDKGKKDGIRVTDQSTMAVVQATLIGQTNSEIVKLLNKVGVRAVGLSGIDANMILCKQMKKELGMVGKITGINPDVIKLHIVNGFLPVIAPIGASADGMSYNLNADIAASEIAIALKAEKLVYLTDTDGVISQSGEVISQLHEEEANSLIKNEVIIGGMIPKVQSAIDAVKGGVNSVHIINGKQEHGMLLEVFTSKGLGTMIMK